ncbi:MAG TPA: hypothetical protein PLS45_07885 [Bacillota bacterium]|nr:hypothetical protein [Bacillota bacterium]HPL99788.1 hypothetical protein [Bacillota bacterium]
MPELINDNPGITTDKVVILLPSTACNPIHVQITTNIYQIENVSGKNRVRLEKIICAIPLCVITPPIEKAAVR